MAPFARSRQHVESLFVAFSVHFTRSRFRPLSYTSWEFRNGADARGRAQRLPIVSDCRHATGTLSLYATAVSRDTGQKSASGARDEARQNFGITCVFSDHPPPLWRGHHKAICRRALYKIAQAARIWSGGTCSWPFTALIRPDIRLSSRFAFPLHAKMCCMGSMKQKYEEQQIVDAVSSSFPSFLNGVRFDAVANDPPDFLGICDTGERIGLELTTWLDHMQTKRAQGRQRMREDLLRIVAQEKHARPTKVLSTVITPKWGNIVPKATYEPLCGEFYAVVHHFDRALPTLRAAHWRPLSTLDRFDYEAHQRELSSYPTLSKYVESIWFSERLASDAVWENHRRVSVLPDGGLYDPSVARRALAEIIKKKSSYYRKESAKARLAAHKLDKLHMLVYAHPELFGTNTSYQTGSQMAKSPVEGLAEVAASAAAGVSPGVFDAIFLFYPALNSRWLAQVWPAFSPMGD